MFAVSQTKQSKDQWLISSLVNNGCHPLHRKNTGRQLSKFVASNYRGLDYSVIHVFYLITFLSGFNTSWWYLPVVLCWCDQSCSSFIFLLHYERSHNSTHRPTHLDMLRQVSLHWNFSYECESSTWPLYCAVIINFPFFD